MTTFKRHLGVFELWTFVPVKEILFILLKVVMVLWLAFKSLSFKDKYRHVYRLNDMVSGICSKKIWKGGKQWVG